MRIDTSRLVKLLELFRSMGVCWFCLWRFDPSTSNTFYGHESCAENWEKELDQRNTEELIQLLPPGTIFDLPLG